MRVEEVMIPDGVWISIMPLSKQSHGDVGGIRDAYGPDLGN